MRRAIGMGIALVALAAPMAGAAVSLPAVLGEHMVVQRDVPFHVWGQASPGEAVTASFRGTTRTAVADDLGRFSLFLPPSKGGGPFSLTVSGSTTIRLDDVWVGDVWVAAGQSNMEWPLDATEGAPAEIPRASHPPVRFLRATRVTSRFPLADVETEGWKVCFIVRQRTRLAFDQFILDREQQSLVENLVQYYQVYGGWENVSEAFSQRGGSPQQPTGVRPGDFRRPWLRFTLVNTDLVIVLDGHPEKIGKTVTKRDLVHALELNLNGKTIGWLLAPTARDLGPTGPEAEFLPNVNSAVVLSALVAVLLALTLGSLLALGLALFGKPFSKERQTEPDQDSIEGDPQRMAVTLLGFWSITSLLAYTYAGEKMPWLTVHIALPMILLSGWSFGDI